MSYTSTMNSSFTDHLNLLLNFEAEGQTVKLTTASIRMIDLELFPFGFLGHLEISVFENEELYEMLSGPKIVKATLTFQSADPMELGKQIIEIKGITTGKGFKRVSGSKNEPEKAQRIYKIDFCDYLRATWQEHYPTNVYVDESMKDILEKHLHPEVKVNFKWNELEKKFPITAFSLEHKHWLKPQDQSNFYSFLIWYLHQEKGLLLYDYKTHQYTITGVKQPLSGDPLEIRTKFIESPFCIFPSAPRYNERLIKHSATSSEYEDKENPHPFDKILREKFDYANYTDFPEQADLKVLSSLESEKSEILIEFSGMSKEMVLDKLTPGSYIKFKSDNEGDWNDDPKFKGKNFRIRSFHFNAFNYEHDDESYKPLQHFDQYVKARLEEEDEKYAEWPKFYPLNPFLVQGKVFSDIGEEEQSTFKIQDSEKAPKGHYLVYVPLAKKCLVVPFGPYESPKRFDPFSKDTQVALWMHFRTARIIGPIGYDPQVRLPAGIQGNQYVYASNGKDKYTLIRHEYVGGKDSVLTIQQSSSEKQLQTVEIKEKSMTLAVEEKDKNSLSFELKNALGCILTRIDKEASIEQQIAMEGDSVTVTCKGDAGTSTFILKPGEINGKGKKLLLDFEDVIINASNSIVQEGKNNFDVKTKVANFESPDVKLGG